jgi:hypothetical protein
MIPLSHRKSNDSFFRFLLLVALCCCVTSLSAQNPSRAAETPCTEYTRLIIDAEQAVEKQEYGLAIRKYNAAKVCNPSLSLKINQQILEVFDRIDEQRLAAERNARLAKEAEREAQLQAKHAENQKILAEEAKLRAEANAAEARAQETRARRFLSEIYFHEAERAAEKNAWDKALLNYYRSYDKDSTRSEALQRSFEAAQHVLPELLYLTE